jgi:hypothetical protein
VSQASFRVLEKGHDPDCIQARIKAPPLWRAGLPALGREAAPVMKNVV